MVLKGRVIDGMGNASIWVKKIEKLFQEKENIKLFHGTLNIKLDKEFKLKHYWIIEPEDYGGTQKVYVQKCKVLKNNCYIVRSNNTVHDKDIIEIVSDINFRKTYKLKNNDEIKIVI